jgi:hypothetical protein
MKQLQNRPLGTNEKIFWVLDQNTTTHFAVVAEIDGNATDQSWRIALNIVQERHPNLFVQIEGDEYATAQFKHIENSRIPLRIIHNNADEDWNKVLEEELCVPFDIRIAPLARAVLIQQPGKSVFMFLSNHSIGDGMSIALLIRDILTVLSGTTIENLLPSSPLDELVGVPVKGIDGDDVKSSGLPNNSLERRSSVHIHRLKLSDALTKNLIERSKVEKTTVHGALSAAIVVALKQTNTGLNKKPVRLLHPLSARTSLSLGENYGLLMNILTLPYNPLPTETFWNFAKEVRQGIVSTQTAEWIKADTQAARELFYNQMELNTIKQALHQATDHEVMLTNLGQISFKSDFAGLKLKSLWGPMVLTPHGSAQTIGVATFNGQLTLTLTSLTQSKSLLKAIETILEKVCSTDHNLQIGQFYIHPVAELINL